MPTTTINFNEDINISAQIGDIAYYVVPTAVGGYKVENVDQIVEVGPITQINHSDNSIVCDANLNPPVDSFIMFRKDPSINTSGINGYYAEVKMINNNSQRDKIELFAVASEIDESSK